MAKPARLGEARRRAERSALDVVGVPIADPSAPGLGGSLVSSTRPRRLQRLPARFRRIWPASRKLILELFSEGAAPIEVCVAMGVPKGTVRHWLGRDDHPAFAEFQRTWQAGLEAAEAWWQRKVRTSVDAAQCQQGVLSLAMANRFGWTSSRVRSDQVVVGEVRVDVAERVRSEGILDRWRAVAVEGQSGGSSLAAPVGKADD